jgi:hypothetical protein
MSMQLASLIQQYLTVFKAQYAARLLPGHLRAIGAIQRCRTADAGQVLWQCCPCDAQFHHPRSCGHRSCPQCQNHETSQWLDRQQAKLLPVEYFMVTFTVPFELRALAWHHQSTFYPLLFATAAGKLAEKWVVDCKHVGQGKPALQYLSRYLYRGVISENNIVANDDGRVTFKYIDSNTGQSQYRTLKGEDFLWLVLQHVLPKGFRRVRDYGFLHGNPTEETESLHDANPEIDPPGSRLRCKLAFRKVSHHRQTLAS